MFNVGGGEILLICLLALIVVGPEQLPGLLRKLGEYAGQARQMSDSLRKEFMAGAEPFQEGMREFQKGMNEFSSTVSESADVRKWGTGSAEDPIVPRGFADQPSGDPVLDAGEAGSGEAGSGEAGSGGAASGEASAVAEPISAPTRAKTMAASPAAATAVGAASPGIETHGVSGSLVQADGTATPSPWAPLPGSGADRGVHKDSSSQPENEQSSLPPVDSDADAAAVAAQRESASNQLAEQLADQVGTEEPEIPPEKIPFHSVRPVPIAPRRRVDEESV